MYFLSIFLFNSLALFFNLIAVSCASSHAKNLPFVLNEGSSFFSSTSSLSSPELKASPVNLLNFESLKDFFFSPTTSFMSSDILCAAPFAKSPTTFVPSFTIFFNFPKSPPFLSFSFFLSVSFNSFSFSIFCLVSAVANVATILALFFSANSLSFSAILDSSLYSSPNNSTGPSICNSSYFFISCSCFSTSLSCFSIIFSSFLTSFSCFFISSFCSQIFFPLFFISSFFFLISSSLSLISSFFFPISFFLFSNSSFLILNSSSLHCDFFSFSSSFFLRAARSAFIFSAFFSFAAFSSAYFFLTFSLSFSSLSFCSSSFIFFLSSASISSSDNFLSGALSLDFISLKFFSKFSAFCPELGLFKFILFFMLFSTRTLHA